ncbi:MAG: hypothetical protein GY811_25700 [Myxococcales bacterium]|nr:hypothetical protein [Myxococcales bacterium]
MTLRTLIVFGLLGCLTGCPQSEPSRPAAPPSSSLQAATPSKSSPSATGKGHPAPEEVGRKSLDAAASIITFVVDRKVVATWTPDDMDGFPTAKAFNRRGHRLQAWDLGELAQRFAGPNGQLLGAGTSLNLPAALSPTSLGLRPVLCRNRREQYRLGWIDKTGQKANGSDYGRGTFLHFARSASAPR